jgi:hypothetical protein
MLLCIPKNSCLSPLNLQSSLGLAGKVSGNSSNNFDKKFLLVEDFPSSKESNENTNQSSGLDCLKLAYKKYRDWFGYLVPIVTTIFLTCFTFTREGELLELMAKPLSYLLNATSLVTIIADSLLVIVPETAEMIDRLKQSLHEVNLKNTLYVLSKIIPLVFIFKVIFGEGFFSRLKKGKKLINKDSLLKVVMRKEVSLVALLEALKAQVVNLDGLTTISSPLKTFVWWIRSRISEGPISQMATHAFKDRQSPKALMLKRAVGTAMMAIMDSWRLGLVKNSSKILSTWFPFLKLTQHECDADGDQLLDFSDLVG